MSIKFVSLLASACSFLLLFNHLNAQQACLDSASLLALDASYEAALRDNDVQKLESLLAEDFLWVHNHVSFVDSKSSVITRAKDPSAGATGNPVDRVSKDVQVLKLGSAAVVTGFTTVVRENSSPHYNFMRTYVEVDGTCFLLASHTMRLPDE